MICTLPDLTASSAQSLSACLRAARRAGLPVAFAAVEEVDLAGVQLVLAHARDCVATGLPPFDGPLPEPLRQALALAGCLNPMNEMDGELLS
ncbi:MAG: hypothetical protein PHR85_06010 [Malikia sp.]|nr:hypothetical protein [Malikia sp.]